MIAYEQLLQVRSPEGLHSWTDRDVMLYALGLGVGRDPLDPAQLAFVTEAALKPLPTFATVAAWGAQPSHQAMGIDYTQVVHAEQTVVLHHTLPACGQVSAVGRVTGAIDKGSKGAIIFRETVLRDVVEGMPLATLRSAIFARADGGFGGPSGPGRPPHAMPDRPADRIAEWPTQPNQALLFRLCGDRNPLHADPETARRAGFAKPILHGLCSYGITCAAVVEHFCDGRPELIAEHAARFSAPMFPGETLLVSLWRDGGTVWFEAKSKERDVAVIRSGRSVLH